MSNVIGDVTVMLTGVPRCQKQVFENESLRSFVERVSSPDFPLNRVETFFVNSQSISNPESHRLMPGSIIAGAPKLKGG